MATDPHESDLATGGAVQHSIKQNGPAVGFGLFLDCVSLFELNSLAKESRKDTHTLHSVRTPLYLKPRLKESARRVQNL